MIMKYINFAYIVIQHYSSTGLLAFVCVDTLHPSQKKISLPGLNRGMLTNWHLF